MQPKRTMFLVATFMAGALLQASPINLSVLPGPVVFTVGDTALSGGVRFPVNPPYGRPAPLPNDVYAISQASGQGSDPVSDLYRSGVAGPPDATNTSIAGPSGVLYGLRAGNTLGLQPGDKPNAVSFGRDGTGPFGTGLLFSVDPDALGAAGTAVRSEADLNRAAGGVFASHIFGAFGVYDGAPIVSMPLAASDSNALVAAPEMFGLAVDKDIPKQSRPGNFEDDLDGLAARESGQVYFTLDPFSLSISPLAGPADILVASIGDGPFSVFRSHTTIGLDPSDAIDALALSLAGNSALFSLAPDSPSLIRLARSPGDVFITNFTSEFKLYAGYSSLGLQASDNLNALEVYAVPEPAAFIPLALSLAALWVARFSKVPERLHRAGFATWFHNASGIGRSVTDLPQRSIRTTSISRLRVPRAVSHEFLA